MDYIYVCSTNFLNNNKETQLGALLICTILKKCGYSCDIIDFDYLFYTNKLKLKHSLNDDLDIMVEEIVKKGPKVVSFYTMCNHYPFTIKLAENLKSKYPNIKIIFAGPQASLTAKETLATYDFIDLVAIGEGEKNISQIVNALINNLNVDDINGIAYRKGNDIFVTKEYEVVKNLDDIPNMDYSMLPKEKIKDFVNLDVGRGCPFGCSFCSTTLFWKKKYRLKSNERIIEEIKFLKKNYNIDSFSFNHDLFTLDKKKLLDFCSKVTQLDFKIKWGCSARIDTLDEEIISNFHLAGCEKIFLGIETGSDRMQKIINKNLKTDDIYKIIKLLLKYDIKIIASFVYGFKEEKEDDLKKTTDMIVKFLQLGLDNIMLNKMSVMAKTNEYEKLNKLLYLDRNQMSTSVCDIKYKDELLKTIESSKELFSSFYNFRCEVRNNYNHLDVFVGAFALFYANYKKTCNCMLRDYNYDLMKIYREYEFLISEMEKKIDSYKFIDAELKHKITWEYFRKMLKEYVYTSKDRQVLEQVMDFEDDVYNFLYMGEESVSYKNYNINYFKLATDQPLHKQEINEKVKVKLEKKSTKIASISRIA